MLNCYPVWTHATPTLRRTIHRIARHGVRHAVLSTVRIVCIATPAWLAVPAPAAAPPVPDTGPIMPPPMLPWPEDGEVPWGWGVGDMPLLAPSDVHGLSMPAWMMQPVSAYVSAPPSSLPISDVGHTDQPVPEPAGVVVMGIGLLVLGIFKGVRR